MRFVQARLQRIVFAARPAIFSAKKLLNAKRVVQGAKSVFQKKIVTSVYPGTISKKWEKKLKDVLKNAPKGTCLKSILSTCLTLSFSL